MQNLINHIIQEEKKLWNSYLFCKETFGYDARETIQHQSKWHHCTELIEMFNLTAPKRNLRQFKSKKFTTSNTTEE